MSNNLATVETKKVKRKKQSQSKEVWRMYRKNQTAVAGLIFIVLFALVVIFADFIAPYELATNMDPGNRLSPPQAGNIFGTDHFGRDIFARILHGGRISLTIGFATAIIGVVVGGLLGAAAGYYGKWIDELIMRIMDVFICIPSILLTLAIIAALGPGIENLLIALTIGSIPGYTRIVRASILTIVEQDYIEAARVGGMSDFRIMVKHILPNAFGPVVVFMTGSLSGMILLAASLSFLGLGVRPPRPEWGAMLSEARDFMRIAPHMMTFPGLAIVFSALSFNMIGDGLRDALDPRMKN